MKEQHAAGRGHSNEDQTAKIKKEVGPCRAIVVNLLRVTWFHLSCSSSLSKKNDSDLNHEISSINRCSLLWKFNS